MFFFVSFNFCKFYHYIHVYMERKNEKALHKLFNKVSYEINSKQQQQQQQTSATQ